MVAWESIDLDVSNLEYRLLNWFDFFFQVRLPEENHNKYIFEIRHVQIDQLLYILIRYLFTFSAYLKH